MRKFSLTAHDKNGNWFTKTMEWENDIISIDIETLEEDTEPEKPRQKIDNGRFKHWEYKKRITSSSGDYMWEIKQPSCLQQGRSIASIFGGEHTKDEARLMAAAPDLVKAAIWHINAPNDYIYTLKRAVIKAGFGDDMVSNVETSRLIDMMYYAPVAMRAMTDFVSEWNEAYLKDAESWVKRFTKIITDAGFAGDIERGNDV